MKKLLNKKNILTLLLLAGIVFSLIQLVRSAPPDPGHAWSSVGDNPSDALSASRGGTGQTSLTAENVLLGNDAGAVTFVAPDAANNVLTSNGTSWLSAALPALFLLYNDETNGTERSANTQELTLKSWVLNVTPSNYSYYILESEVLANQGQSANTKVQFNWNFKEGANLKKTIVWRTIGETIAGIATGIQYEAPIKTIISNSIPSSANLLLNGQMNVSNTSTRMNARSFRVYGVK